MQRVLHRRPEVLRRAFSLIPSYLQTSDASRAVNMMDYGVALGRRFRALKLWFVMRSYGREGPCRNAPRARPPGAGIRRRVDADPRFERVAPVPFSVVSFRYQGTDDENRAILERVNASGDVFISAPC